MIKMVDSNNDGTVDFDEFVILMAKQLKIEQDREEELVEVYKVFDVDGDGKISIDDLIKKFSDLGETLSEEEAARLIKTADKTKDTYINFTEFVKVMMYDTDDKTVVL
jgi:calmodulin